MQDISDRNVFQCDLQSLSLFQKVLMATDGTVTDLIALYTGEKIEVKKLHQFISTTNAPQLLQCLEDARLLHRTILLTGEIRSYLYANSIFVVERLSPSIQTQLLETNKPIGLMWKAERLETYREIVEQQIETQPDIAPHFNLAPEAAFVSRTYLIYAAGQPLGAITEKWPLSYFRDLPG